MVSNIKNFFLTNISAITIALAALLTFGLSATVNAQSTTDPNINSNLCSGANLEFGNTQGCDQGDPKGSVNDLIATIINIFSVVVGVVAVIMIIIGGFRYITSGGDSGNVTGAKNTILYAVIGLVIVAFAQFIVRFVLQSANDAAAGN